jgi:hypothetical protein
MTYSLFYNQVLSELMSGTFQDGVNLLVGMLDNVSHDSATKRSAAAALREHDLDAFLSEHPFYKAQDNTKGRTASLANLFCGDDLDTNVSTTGRRLFEATNQLTFARAVRDRRKCTTKSLTRAWQSGQKICVMGEGQWRALDALAGQDVSNVTLIEQDSDTLSAVRAKFGVSLKLFDGEIVEWADETSHNANSVDLICASDFPDHTAQAELASVVILLQGCLSEHGKIQFAGFAPGHLGSGWREIGLRWDMHCYDEGQWQALGDQAGLHVRACRDVSNSVVWGEFTKNSDSSSWGAQSYGR